MLTQALKNLALALINLLLSTKKQQQEQEPPKKNNKDIFNEK